MIVDLLDTQRASKYEEKDKGLATQIDKLTGRDLPYGRLSTEDGEIVVGADPSPIWSRGVD